LQSSPLLSIRRWARAALFAASAGALAWHAALAGNVIYVVQPNDDLYRIGLKYGISWTAIMDANGLSGTTIYVGEQLIIPVDASAVALPTATPPAPHVAATPTTAPPRTQTAAPTDVPTSPPDTTPVASTPAAPTSYVVQTGDTLFHIAAQFGVSVPDIAAANNLYNASIIYAGQTLAIPGAQGVNPASTKEIIVSLSQQHLYGYENGALVHSFVASTGEPGSPTWTGTFSVLDKIPDAYGANWDIWMPNWLGIYWAGNLEDGIHALPILANGQRLWDGYLGTPVSFGCVILSVADAQTLYDWADVGTPVIVQQ
jgi:LysM repeat protein